jgi:outer membrane protein assembly factor BamB
MPRSIVQLAVGVVVLGSCYRGSTSSPLANSNGGEEPRAGRHWCRVDDVGAEPLDLNPDGRLRTQTSGSLAGADNRSWEGRRKPRAIPEKVGTLELFLLDKADGGLLAFYRDPYGVGSCGLGDAANCAYEARFYKQGQMEWALPFERVLSRTDHLEIQDIRYADGVLYFNEACQSYASGANGQCSSLVAVDPRAGEVLWRTNPLVSNGRFRLRGCYIVAGYGFTAEPDNVFLVERATGKVTQKIAVSSAPEVYQLMDREHLDVTLYQGNTRSYFLENFDGENGKIVELLAPEPAALFGGATYGGLGYGGLGYGGVRP